MSANRETPSLWARAIASIRLVVFYAFSALYIPVIVAAALLKPGDYLYYRLVRAWVAAALAIFGVRVESAGAGGLTAGKDYVLLVNHAATSTAWPSSRRSARAKPAG